jgi:hypothetical protein
MIKRKHISRNLEIKLISVCSLILDKCLATRTGVRSGSDSSAMNRGDTAGVGGGGARM